LGGKKDKVRSVKSIDMSEVTRTASSFQKAIDFVEDIELEIKLNLSTDQFRQLRDRFDSAGYECTHTSQIDIYYSPSNEDFFSDTTNDKCLRIREEDGKQTITYKQIFSSNSELHSHMVEYETLIESSIQMEKILEVLSVNRVLELKKERFKYIIDKRFDVSLDSVDGLGYFIEIEALSINDNDNVENVNKNLIAFARSLDVDISNRNAEGYSNLAYNLHRQKI
jgi:adenylate cyclase class 2